MTQALIKTTAVSLDYGNTSVLQTIDLSLHSNHIVTVIGPNGAGKTSLVKIIVGLLKPTGGHIERQTGIRIGYVPQRVHIDRSLPLSVERFLRLSRRPVSAIKQTLAEVEADHLLRQSLHGLSGGEWQRVLLARALLQEPQLLVLDEPAQGVDIRGQAKLYQLITALRDRYHCGILMVSHDLHWVMAQTDTVICLNQHICCQGHPEQVSHDPAYLRLFGSEHTIAMYRHHHDHHHDVHGRIIHGESDA